MRCPMCKKEVHCLHFTEKGERCIDCLSVCSICGGLKALPYPVKKLTNKKFVNEMGVKY